MDLMKKDLRMTSRDLAEITGKQHAHVMRDIRDEIENLEKEGIDGQSIFGESFYINSQNKEMPEYEFGREGAMQIATRYSAPIRRKLIIRLDELENSNKLNVPQTYAQALLEAGRLALENEKLILENNAKEEIIVEQTPKVEYYNKVLDSDSEFTTTQIAKELFMSAIQLNVILSNKGVQFKQNGQWLLYAKYQNKGYTKTRTTIFEDSKGKEQTKHITVWTESGREFIHNLIEEL